MLFSSTEFVFFFLPPAISLFYAARQFSIRASHVILLLASLYFYGQFKPIYVLLILASIATNYLTYRFAIRLDHSVLRRMIVTVGILFNVALIGFYKYIGFILLDVLGMAPGSLAIEIPVLPLAISFFTFQQISFLADHRDSAATEEPVPWLDYAVYITFFPQLIAGPIVRHNEFLPQMRRAAFDVAMFSNGVVLFSLGLAKKVLIADSISPIVGAVFDEGGAQSMVDAWTGALMYSFQLYFDFSGYSDMALGIGLMFGFALPINFNSPYKAASIQEFWRRWHITLSNWLRDYLYIPLGGSKRSAQRTYANLVITMLIGGLWHGAGFTFVIWGGLHGIALAINRLWSKMGRRLHPLLGWGLTFIFVVNTWVVFRAESLQIAREIYTLMYLIQPPGETSATLRDRILGDAMYFSTEYILVLVLLTSAVTVLPNSQTILHLVNRKGRAVAIALSLYCGLLFGLAVKRMMEIGVPNEFIYFQF